MTNKRTLAELRTHIKQIDRDLINLLNDRARLSLEVGALKSANGQKVFDPSQEVLVLEHVHAANNGPLEDKALQAIYREIISVSRSLQEPPAIHCLGPEGSFTHMAAQRYFGQSSDYFLQNSIKGVFQETAKKDNGLGVVPIENSLEGSVNLTLDGLVETRLKIMAETTMRISHCLLAVKTSWEQVTKVYSHPQALAQCQSWLKGNLPAARLIGVESTAQAAILASKEPESAAIGSFVAGERYGLNILAQSIEDNENNLTRFLVLGQGSTNPTGNDKTSLIFSTAHRPGALHAALGVLAQRQVNLLKIQSHPMKGRLWEYLFFVDFAGHAAEETIDRCLQELAGETTFLKILGSYPLGE
jgi:chorismate mutase/prephenate dehydratase